MELLINDQPVSAVSVTEWQELELSCLPLPGVVLTLRVGTPATPMLAPFLRPGDPAWRWRWNPQNTVGRVPLLLQAVWPDGRSETIQHFLQVLPRKIDQERYSLLLADLQQVATALLFGPAGATLGVCPASGDTRWGRTLLEEYYSLFDERFNGLEQAVERIARRPATHLHPVSARVDPGQVRDFTHLNDDRAVAMAGSIPARPDTPPLPPEVTERRAVASADTYENRLLKSLLDELRRRVCLISAVLEHDARRFAPAQDMARQLQTVQVRLQVLRTLPFLEQVGPLTRFHGASPLLQRDPAYRQVYRYWQTLRRLPFPELDSPLFHMPVQDLPRLYESWCVLQLVRSLLGLPGVQLRSQQLLVPPAASGAADGDSLVSGETAAYRLALVEDRPLLAVTWHTLTLSLRYQPRYAPLAAQRSHHPADAPAFGSLDCHTRVPDLAVEIERADHPGVLVVCDAKYRLDARGGVPEDALADAYTYLGSLGSHTGQPATRSVALLYPGQGLAAHYASGVATLPLLPGATGALATWLEQQLSSFL